MLTVSIIFIMCLKARYADLSSDCYHFYLHTFLLSVTFRYLKTIITVCGMNTRSIP